MLRDWYCLERMHRAFKRGLMTYGMIRGRKKAAGGVGSEGVPWSSWPRMLFSEDKGAAEQK